MDEHFFRHDLHQSTDVHQHAASLALWEQRYEQIASGTFHGSIEELQIGPVQVFREQTDRAVLQQGRPRPGTTALAIALGGCGDSWLCGHQLNQAGRCVMLGEGEFELIARDRLDVLALDIDRAALAEHARLIAGPQADPALDFDRLGSLLQAGNDPAQAELCDLLLGTLQTARDTPALLRHAAMRRAWVHTACDLLLARLQPLAAAPQPAPSAARRRQVVQAARAYMREHAHEAIDVPQLCAVLGVSRRTLQYSFESVLQMSPVAYLRVLRLNGLRRDLCRAGAQATVADCAAQWGFWHLPRLAGDYRALFGELPSQTLLRQRGSLH